VVVRADGSQPEHTQRPCSHVGMALLRLRYEPIQLGLAHELLLLFDQAGRAAWITVRHGMLSIS
jgi:hypothetical protein